MTKPKNNLSIANEPGETYGNNKVEVIQQKTITILEREVEDLRSDKDFLKTVINEKLGKEEESA